MDNQVPDPQSEEAIRPVDQSDLFYRNITDSEQVKAKVILHKGKARPFWGRHPWVFKNAIHSIEGNPADGDIIDLFSDTGKFIARGLFNSNSNIRVRLYSWDENISFDNAFWRNRLSQAIDYRERLVSSMFRSQESTSPHGIRLVYSEADGLSGLIIDQYGKYLVLQVNSLAIYRRLPGLVEILRSLLDLDGIFIRTDPVTAKAENADITQGLFCGELPAKPIIIHEHGLKFHVDLSLGQKTGYYLDQRDNRLAAASYMQDRSVLDVCSYTGGFAVYASAIGKAKHVTCLDSSERALDLANANAELNQVANIDYLHGDCFEMLDELVQENYRYDAIILDPPKFARSRARTDEALRAYHRLNRVAVSLLNPDGILVTNSCSGLIPRQDFVWMLAEVAQKSGRQIQFIEQRGAAADHPVSATCLENEYLKCFICRVI